MNLRRITATAVLVTAALGVGSGISFADPAPAAPRPNSIGYEMKLVDRTVVTTLDGGVFAVSGDGSTINIKDNAGNTVVDLPLSFRLDNVTYPLLQHEVKVDGRVLELAPSPNISARGPLLVKPVASPVENSRAQAEFSQRLSIAMQVGGFVGMAIGAVIGWAACGFVILPLCVATITSGAGFGALIGTLVAGGPELVSAGTELIQALNAPPGTTKWANPTR